jgi:hypothetical protein
MITHRHQDEALPYVTTPYRQAWGKVLTHINNPKTARKAAHRARESRLYAVPDPVESSLEHDKFHHFDLDALSLEGLHREHRRVQHVLDFADRPPPWLLERLAAIRQTLAERQLSPNPTPEQPAGNPYQRRHAARVARFKSQLYADPYLGAPERRAQGIPVAVLIAREPSDEQR